ncbi:MAG: histidine phosphatase family protein [Gemmatimonadetes bacterium]|nr:histidine phosphatase family protein [Gemmatimonadota bacterium]MBT7859563.1 histidine phosphatase family protein [Gemmatimonadota bacterium]
MKTLLIMRHAKSDWSTARQEDVDRVLNKRGRNDLPRMGRAIAATAPPERVLASSAARARETAEGVKAFLPGVQIQYEDGLYLASPKALHDTLAREGHQAETVMMVAHNPGLEQWIGELCGAQVALPTAGLACIDFGASDWTRINRGAGQLRFYLIPRLLKAMEQQE